MTLQSLIISKNKMKKKLLNINCHILSNEIRWCFVHNKRTTGYVLDIGQHQNINIYYFNYNYSLRTICCTVWNLMTIHIVLIIQIWEWTLEGQTGILCMVIHSSILKWKISNSLSYHWIYTFGYYQYADLEIFLKIILATWNYGIMKAN